MASVKKKFEIFGARCKPSGMQLGLYAQQDMHTLSTGHMCLQRLITKRKSLILWLLRQRHPRYGVCSAVSLDGGRVQRAVTLGRQTFRDPLALKAIRLDNLT